MRIVNNYARMNFNFGPTLLSWLNENAQRTYRMILDGERRSRERYNGHSSAIAQAYNHMIMPLASTRDRNTQIRWGIADYQAAFGTSRKACGFLRLPPTPRPRAACGEWHQVHRPRAASMQAHPSPQNRRRKRIGVGRRKSARA